MKIVNIAEELSSNSYPGRGIVLGKTPDGKKQLLPILLWAEAKTAATVFLKKMTEAEFAQRHLMKAKWLIKSYYLQSCFEA